METKSEQKKINELAEVKGNIKISFLQFGNFVFVETLCRREETREERQPIVPYAFPDFTSPMYSVLWSAFT